MKKKTQIKEKNEADMIKSAVNKTSPVLSFVAMWGKRYMATNGGKL